MKKAFFVLPFCFVLVSAQPHFKHPTLPPDDLTRMREVYRLADAVQDKIWKDWSKAPFALLLVTPEHEFLVRHPRATNNFDTAGYDDGLKSLLLYRRRTIPQNLLATYPAVNGYPTIVAGQPENTNVKNSIAWVVTVLHEHFHQLQMSQPNYYADTEALGLTHGDKTGMWMLNYPFPYDSAIVIERFSVMCKALSEALAADDGQFAVKLRAFRAARTAFKNTLPPDDYKYFSLQLWQEGVSRYTEWRVAKLAGERYTPTKELQALKDYMPFAARADSLRSRILTELPKLPMAEWKRVVFYTFGAAEAMLLDRVNPKWQEEYLKKKFYLEEYYE